jgi:uncharacterized protein
MTPDSFEKLGENAGFLHRPSTAAKDGMVLTHGAGGNANNALLLAMAKAFADAGFLVLRYNLPFRQQRPFGPPRPGNADRDRAGLKEAVAAMRSQVSGRVFLGGHSYGGRQASMLCAEEPEVANALLLTSYPLHPPGNPEQLRTQHLPKLRIPVLFVEGTRDPFASIQEIEAARKLIPGKTRLLTVAGAGHDLGFKGKTQRNELPVLVLAEFEKLVRGNS